MPDWKWLWGRKIVRYVMPIVEQLDRATRELAVDHPINSRLALILIDNATELIVQRRCQDAVRQDTVFRRLGEGSLTSKQRREARGAYLEPKLGVMGCTTLVSDTKTLYAPWRVPTFGSAVNCSAGSDRSRRYPTPTNP